jgi:hypothetical protein
MRKIAIFSLFSLFIANASAQLLVSRDTINVIENGSTLKMPWGNGLNFSNFSNIDLNYDGKMDIVAFDRINLFNVGRFRCFVQTSTPGTYSVNPQLSYSFPPVSNWAMCLDYDGDGKNDIFCSTSAGIKVYKNTGNGTNGLQFTLHKNLLYTNYGGTITNLYAASNGIPGLSDIDNDGDIDVLTYAPAGIMIEYNKNLSVETYGHNDSLNLFEVDTLCWGGVIENNCAIAMGNSCTSTGFVKPYPEYWQKSNLHSGSCLTCIDSDGDGDKDIIAGDIGCNIALYGHNGGTAATAQITQTSNSYPNFPATSNTININLNNFPCTYNLYVDGDTKKDLIASPNANGGENTACVWYYRNASATNTVDFQLIKKNLFQDEMIEVGTASYPVLFDENNDGKKDLLLGTHGYYSTGSNRGKLTLYRNIGTNTQPSYSLITRDYAGLSTYSINAIMPAVGDVDGDNDVDLVIGNMTGQVYLLTNTAGSLSPCAFTGSLTGLFTTTSAIAAPQLFDIDLDGKLDLMIGCKNGKIFYYRNTGSVNSPTFSLITGNFGGISTLGDPLVYSIDGYAAPHFFMQGGQIKMLAGSISGQIFYYSVPSSTDVCNLINTNTNAMNEGGQSTVWYEDVNGDGNRDLFVGNGSGGLSFFSSMGPDVLVKEEQMNVSNVSLYPNPTANELTIRIEKIEFKTGKVKLFDIMGRELKEIDFTTNTLTINTSELQSGIYFARVEIQGENTNSNFTSKIIKE